MFLPGSEFLSSQRILLRSDKAKNEMSTDLTDGKRHHHTSLNETRGKKPETHLTTEHQFSELKYVFELK